MSRLWIYTKNQCECFDVDSIKEYSGFLFVKKSQGLCIFYGQNKKILRFNESCTILDTSFYLEEKESQISYFPIASKIQIGRSELCDIQLCAKGISRFHFKIEDGVLTDLNSLNGTYVNTRRVNTWNLKIQDEIVAANIRMIYLKNYLLLDMVDNPYDSKNMEVEGQCH